MTEYGRNSPAIGTLMLIDDDTIDQMLYRRIVEESGLVGNYLAFVSAEDALDALRAEPHVDVDAILLDINMPRMDGFEFLEAASAELGDEFTKIVVIMLTTSLDPTDQERAASYSVVKDYLDKPLLQRHLEHIAEMLKAE